MAQDDEPKCQASRVQQSLDSVLGSLIAVTRTMTSIESSSTKLAESMKEIRDVLVHFHNSHLHPRIHDGQENFDTKEYGKSFAPIPVTPADKLLHEFNTNYDSDSNGLIYGTDFKLRGKLPRALKEVNATISDKSVKQILTLNEYIKTVPNHEHIWHK